MKPAILTAFLALCGCVHAQYCMLGGQVPYSSLQPGITNFKLNTINRSSSNSESSSAVVVTTGQTTTLTPGQTYVISISHSEDTQFFPGARNNLRVWIDYNSNYSYLDAGETVLSVDLEPPGTTYTASFTLPLSTPAGTLALRATAKMSSDAGHTLPTPCNVPADPLGYHGEMEDYVLVIAGTSQAPTAAFALSASTLCTQGTVNVTNSSSGTPAPTFSWSASPATGVSFVPSATVSTPSVKFSTSGHYTITCIAANSAGTNSAVHSVTVSACNLTAINEPQETAEAIYPVPADEFFTVKAGDQSPGTVDIRDITGRLLYNTAFEGPRALKISTSQLDNGRYFITISRNSGVTTTSFMVAH